jgi:hypothetical protein
VTAIDRATQRFNESNQKTSSFQNSRTYSTPRTHKIWLFPSSTRSAPIPKALRDGLPRQTFVDDVLRPNSVTSSFGANDYGSAFRGTMREKPASRGKANLPPPSVGVYSYPNLYSIATAEVTNNVSTAAIRSRGTWEPQVPTVETVNKYPDRTRYRGNEKNVLDHELRLYKSRGLLEGKQREVGSTLAVDNFASLAFGLQGRDKSNAASRLNDISHVYTPGEFFDITQSAVNVRDPMRQSAIFKQPVTRQAVDIENVVQGYMLEKLGRPKTSPEKSTRGFSESVSDGGSMREIVKRPRSYTTEVNKAFGDGERLLRMRKSSSVKEMDTMQRMGSSSVRPNTAGNYEIGSEAFTDLTKSYVSKKTGVVYERTVAKRGPTSVVLVPEHNDAVTLGRTMRVKETREGWDWRPVTTDINDKSGLSNVFKSRVERFKEHKIEDDLKEMEKNGVEARKISI